MLEICAHKNGRHSRVQGLGGFTLNLAKAVLQKHIVKQAADMPCTKHLHGVHVEGVAVSYDWPNGANLKDTPSAEELP